MRVLPERVRGHLNAIYGYARLVDNLGDEYPGNRTEALAWAEAQLDAMLAGEPDHRVFARLEPTVNRFGLTRDPFARLLLANRLDQHKKSYSTWEQLMIYCKLSANPVGHLVLAVFEADTPERVAASDNVCSGLQVLEHLQDLGEDAAAGRVYLPADDMASFGVRVEDLLAPVASPRLRGLIAYEVSRARDLLDSGRELAASLDGYARLAIAGFTAGGMAGLDAIDAAHGEVLARKPRPSTMRTLWRLADLCTGDALRAAIRSGSAAPRSSIVARAWRPSQCDAAARAMRLRGEVSA